MPATRAVLFDFGGTLFDYADLAGAQLESLSALAARIGLDGLGPAELAVAHRNATARVFRDYLEKPSYLHADLFSDALREMARSLGIELSAEDLAHYFAVQHAGRRRDFRLRVGVAETLGELRRRGLHLGIVSNIDEADLQHLIDLAGLRSHFDSLLSSEAAGSCKPDRRIYDAALERARCAPEEALFVGDSLAQDIAGANRVGVRSVLIWHRDDREPPAEGPRPAHVIRNIPDVLRLVE